MRTLAVLALLIGGLALTGPAYADTTAPTSACAVHVDRSRTEVNGAVTFPAYLTGNCSGPQDVAVSVQYYPQLAYKAGICVHNAECKSFARYTTTVSGTKASPTMLVVKVPPSCFAQIDFKSNGKPVQHSHVGTTNCLAKTTPGKPSSTPQKPIQGSPAANINTTSQTSSNTPQLAMTGLPAWEYEGGTAAVVLGFFLLIWFPKPERARVR